MAAGWERRLALQVIYTAWLDLRGGSASYRDSARVFFDGDAVEHWCDVAGLDPRRVRRAAHARGTR